MEYVTLSNGVKMPLLGFGTYQVTNEADGLNSIKAAIKAGYRLIDTAQAYHNEELVGQAIRESGVPREEFFITTKIWFRDHSDPKPSLDESLRKLGVDYIDLVLIHWPFNDYYNAWRALEEYYLEGKIRAIGISNFDNARVIDLCTFSKIKPMVNQIEMSVYVQKEEQRKINQEYGVVVQAYGPLGHGKQPDLVNESILQEIGKKYHKTGAQIALRYLIDLGISIIPKSSHENRIKENFDILDFKLDKEDMEKFKTLNTGVPVVGDVDNPATLLKMLTKK